MIGGKSKLATWVASLALAACVPGAVAPPTIEDSAAEAETGSADEETGSASETGDGSETADTSETVDTSETGGSGDTGGGDTGGGTGGASLRVVAQGFHPWEDAWLAYDEAVFGRPESCQAITILEAPDAASAEELIGERVGECNPPGTASLSDGDEGPCDLGSLDVDFETESLLVLYNFECWYGATLDIVEAREDGAGGLSLDLAVTPWCEAPDAGGRSYVMVAIPGGSYTSLRGTADVLDCR